MAKILSNPNCGLDLKFVVYILYDILNDVTDKTVRVITVNPLKNIINFNVENLVHYEHQLVTVI